MIHRIRCTNRMPALFNCNNNEQLSLEWDWHRPSYFCYFCYWWCTVQLTAYNKGKSVRVERNSYHWIKGPRRKEKNRNWLNQRGSGRLRLLSLCLLKRKSQVLQRHFHCGGNIFSLCL